MQEEDTSIKSFIESCLLPTRDHKLKIHTREIYKLYEQYVDHFKLFKQSKKILALALAKRFNITRCSNGRYYHCEVRPELINKG
jgi:hypothetical protein